MWYLCGLGSNIEPGHNMSEVLYRLIEEVEWIWISEILETKPVGMQTTRNFVNALVVFWSVEERKNLKLKLNAIEAKMGRDRSDPDRKQKDHTMDIDIIDCSDRPWFEGKNISEEYFRMLFEGSREFENKMLVSFGKHVLGEKPIVIFRNSDDVDVVVEC